MLYLVSKVPPAVVYQCLGNQPVSPSPTIVAILRFMYLFFKNPVRFSVSVQPLLCPFISSLVVLFIQSQEDPVSLPPPSASGMGSRMARLQRRSGEAAPFRPMPQDWAALWICHRVSSASALECLRRSAWPCRWRKDGKGHGGPR